jgi:hypothetical protein
MPYGATTARRFWQRSIRASSGKGSSRNGSATGRKVTDGRITRIDDYADRARALTAAGLNGN